MESPVLDPSGSLVRCTAWLGVLESNTGIFPQLPIFGNSHICRKRDRLAEALHPKNSLVELADAGAFLG